jgi:hypothetical protein
MLGLSPELIQQHLSGRGKSVQVANFSVVATRRNVEWAIVDELFKSKAPKLS